MCVHLFVYYINRIRVMRYWWGRDMAHKGREGKKTENIKEREADKNREVD